MTEKKKPERMCIACRRHDGKQGLVRVVKNADGEIKIDTTFKAPGRGAYVCRDKKCIELAEKKNALSRALKANADKTLYEELIKLVD